MKTKEQILAIILMRKNGMSANDIAYVISNWPRNVKYILNKYIAKKRKEYLKDNYAPFIFNLLEAGLDFKEIAARLNLDVKKVKAILGIKNSYKIIKISFDSAILENDYYFGMLLGCHRFYFNKQIRLSFYHTKCYIKMAELLQYNNLYYRKRIHLPSEYKQRLQIINEEMIRGYIENNFKILKKTKKQHEKVVLHGYKSRLKKIALFVYSKIGVNLSYYEKIYPLLFFFFSDLFLYELFFF